MLCNYSHMFGLGKIEGKSTGAVLSEENTHGNLDGHHDNARCQGWSYDSFCAIISNVSVNINEPLEKFGFTYLIYSASMPCMFASPHPLELSVGPKHDRQR